jgi:hypothetical protein
VLVGGFLVLTVVMVVEKDEDGEQYQCRQSKYIFSFSLEG